MLMMEGSRSGEKNTLQRKPRKKQNDELGGGNGRRNQGFRRNYNKAHQKRNGCKQGYNSNKNSRKPSASSDSSQNSDSQRVSSNNAAMAKGSPLMGYASLFKIVSRTANKTAKVEENTNEAQRLLRVLDGVEKGQILEKKESKCLPSCCFGEVPNKDQIPPQTTAYNIQLTLKLRILMTSNDGRGQSSN